MANRNVNKVILIGNLTRDPELRYTPQGSAVANFTIATNRSWTVDGVQKEAVDFHNVVAWNKLAELCGQLLTKGTKVYVEGRLQTRNWMDESSVKHYKTEVNIDEMIVLSAGKGGTGTNDEVSDVSEADMSTANGSDDDIDIDQLLDEMEKSTESADADETEEE